MTDKKIYEILNDVNMEFGRLDEVDDLEKQRFKNNFKTKNNHKNHKKKIISIAGLALVIGLTSQTQLGTRVYASAQSKLNDIGYSISQALNLDSGKDIDDYSNIINKTVESNGVGIKITDIIIDKDELIISSLVDVSGLKDRDRVKNIGFEDVVSINGRKIQESGGGGSVGPVEDMEYIFSDIRHISIEDLDLEGKLTMDIELNKLKFSDEDYNNHDLKGKWTYNFIASGKELSKSTNKKDLNHEFTIENTVYKLNEFRYNPINQKIYGTIDRRSPSKKSYDIELRGQDDLGNPIMFYASSINKDKIVFKYENYGTDLNMGIKSLSLTPYAVPFPEKSGRMSDDFKRVGEEFIIDIK